MALLIILLIFLFYFYSLIVQNIDFDSLKQVQDYNSIIEIAKKNLSMKLSFVNKFFILNQNLNNTLLDFFNFRFLK